MKDGGESSTERGRHWQLTRCVRKEKSNKKNGLQYILVTRVFEGHRKLDGSEPKIENTVTCEDRNISENAEACEEPATQRFSSDHFFLRGGRGNPAAAAADAAAGHKNTTVRWSKICVTAGNRKNGSKGEREALACLAVRPTDLGRQ